MGRFDTATEEQLVATLADLDLEITTAEKLRQELRDRRREAQLALYRLRYGIFEGCVVIGRKSWREDSGESEYLVTRISQAAVRDGRPSCDGRSKRKDGRWSNHSAQFISNWHSPRPPTEEEARSI